MLPQAVADALLSLKDTEPNLSIPQLIRAARETRVANRLVKITTEFRQLIHTP